MQSCQGYSWTKLLDRIPRLSMQLSIHGGSFLKQSLTDNEKWIVHTLNRLGYGQRPGDLERVRRMGLADYITLQLSPGRIPDPTV